jgi:anion-transporting  ArsA/GET3 family ATPase
LSETALLDRSLVFVTGKGGVGKTTIAAALGVAAAEAGRRVIVCEVGRQERLAHLFRRSPLGSDEVELRPGMSATSIDPNDALREWLAKQLGSGAVATLMAQRSVFSLFVAAAPGAREMITMSKAWEIAQPERWTERSATYDLVIVDAPATGHGLAMLGTPGSYSEVARVGPIRRQAEKVRGFLSDPARAGYVAVALAEEMPVTETIELESRLGDELGVGLGAVVANALHPERFSGPELRALEVAERATASGETAAVLAAARAQGRRSRDQRRQLRRLRRDVDAPVIGLPFLAEPDLGPREAERLGRELARRL